MWTQFWDMHSGGETKIKPYEKIYIEADRNSAIEYFIKRFGRDPDNITCSCCGEDYNINEDKSIEQLTGYHRECRQAYFDKNGKEISYDKYKENTKENTYRYVEDENNPRCQNLGDYMNNLDVLFIFAKEVALSKLTQKEKLILGVEK